MEIPPGCAIDGTTFARCDRSCTGEFSVPDGITAIDSWAFHRCSDLINIHLPASVTGIEVGAFSNCSSLASITIPNSVNTLGYWAFELCSSLASVNIPDGVRTIEAAVFRGCSSLTGVVIPSSVASIGASAFSGCTRMEYAIVPKSCDVAENAFPSSCKIFTDLAEYQIHLAKEIVAERAVDGVDIVGMHTPQQEPVVDSRCGRCI